MTDKQAQAQLRALIRDRLGAIMHNPVREPGTTCRVCFTPLPRPGYTTCWECHQHRIQAQAAGSLTLADHTVALTYALEGQQSNLDMHRYKDLTTSAQRVASNAWQRVSLLVVGFGLWHACCIDRASQASVTLLATVPSLRGRPGQDPLADLTAYLPHAWQRTPVRVTTAFNRLLDLPGVSVTDVSFLEDRIIADVALPRRRLNCPVAECGFTTRARYDTRPVSSCWRHLDLGRWGLVVRADLPTRDGP